MQERFPVIDMEMTGRNIKFLRLKKGLSVRDLQDYFGFEQPQAIYKWQWGQALPSVDNLYALSVLLDTPIEDILIEYKCERKHKEQSADADCSLCFKKDFSRDTKGTGSKAHFIFLPCPPKGG